MRLWVLALCFIGVAGCTSTQGVVSTETQPASHRRIVAVDGSVIGTFVDGEVTTSEPELEPLLRTELERMDLPAAVSIRTSFDPEYQHLLRQVLDPVPVLGKGLVAGAVVLDRMSGAVRAIALSDYGESAGGLDALLGIGRPTGSALKPLALAAALDAGQSLETVYPAPECIALPDEPDRETCGGTGVPETLLDATVGSLNPVFVQVVARIGVRRFGSVARALGIVSGADYARIDAVLGTYPVSVMQMAGAYRAIAEGGEYVAPHLLATDNSGQSLEPVAVLSRSVWADVDEVLHQVIKRGTGVRADPGVDSAGKTGTALGLTDAWFVGYTDEIAAAVWVGFGDDPDAAMVFPATPATITGGSLPAELWAQIAAGYGSAHSISR